MTSHDEPEFSESQPTTWRPLSSSGVGRARKYPKGQTGWLGEGRDGTETSINVEAIAKERAGKRKSDESDAGRLVKRGWRRRTRGEDDSFGDAVEMEAHGESHVEEQTYHRPKSKSHSKTYTRAGRKDRLELIALREEVQQLEAELEWETALAKTLQERFTSQRNRTIDHDGNFQVMDDACSRDRVVKRFQLLFSSTDIYSQKLEDIYEHHSTQIEEQSTEYFLTMLSAAFRQSAKLVNGIHQSLLALISYELHGRVVPHSARVTRGAMNLTREWLRKNTLIFPRESLMDEILKKAEDASLHQFLLGITESSLNSVHRKVVQDFTESCADIAWRLQVLPMPVSIREAQKGDLYNNEFFERNASSSGKSRRVKELFWPALILEESGKVIVIAKGTVVT